MTATNPNADLFSINSYIKFGQNCPFLVKILSGNEILEYIKGHNSGTNFQKMNCNNPKLDLVNMNAYILFGENMSSSSQDIERKRNSGVSQGP